MECKSKNGISIETGLIESFPLCKRENPELFYDVCHHYLIMSEVADKMSIPIEELLEFFYKGKLKFDLLKEQEEVLRRYEQGDTLLREMPQNDGPKSLLYI